MNTADTKRPLSPHLQVYKLPYNALMSIIGRAVGVILSLAVTVILAWVIAIVWNPPIFDATMNFLDKPLIGLMFQYFLIFGAFVVFFYLGNGIRHVLWDWGIGVTPKAGRLSGNIVLVISAFLTLFLWLALCGCFSGENSFDISAHLAMFRGDKQ